MNTLYSLSTRYQTNANHQNYEVIVIENQSNNNLNPIKVRAFGPQFHYYLREESGISPASAINDGLKYCTGSHIGLMIDGARLLSPGVITHAMQAIEKNANAIIAVPSYDLGPELQQHSSLTGYNESTELELLSSIDWPHSGYNLFNIAVLGEANDKGYINPIMECTCLFAPKEKWRAIGGANEDFQQAGGGALNLHIFRSLGLHLDCKYYVLPGEGTFHQYHEGVTTGAIKNIEATTNAFHIELNKHWDGQFHGLRREPILLGPIDKAAKKYFDFSMTRAEKRKKRLKRQGKPLWLDDQTK